MNVSQFYETSIVDRDTGSRIDVLVVPWRLLMDGRDPEPWERTVETATSLLEVNAVQPIFPSALPRVIAALLGDGPDRPPARDARDVLRALDGPASIQPSQYAVHAFAEYVAYGDTIPTEGSDFRLHSLASLSVTVPAGMMSMAVASVAGTPAAVVVGLASIVLVHAAQGIGEGLHEGLRYRILRRMGVPDDGRRRPPHRHP